MSKYLKEELRKPYRFEIVEDLPKINKIYFEWDGDVKGPFNTKEEAKAYFMENCELTIIVGDLPMTYSDVLYYTDIEEDDEDLVYDWEEEMTRLADECEVYYRPLRREMEGVKTELTGTPNDLIKFMENYTTHYIDDGTEGEALYEERMYLIQEIDKAFNSLGFFR